MFQEIELQWCLPAFQNVTEVNSPTEMLALYSQVRESAAQIVEQVGENPGNEVPSQPPRDGTSAHGSWLALLNNLTCFTC